MTIRWKPRSEKDGRLVVLTNQPFALYHNGQPVRGQNYGPSNGYRYTVRFPSSGSSYSGGVIRTSGGTYSIPDGGRNYGGGKGPELPRGGSQVASQGRTQPRGLQGLRQELATMSLPERREYLQEAIRRDPQLPAKLGYKGPQTQSQGGYQQGSLNPVEAIRTGRSLYNMGQKLFSKPAPEIPTGSNLARNIAVGPGRVVGPASGGYAGGAGQLQQAGGAWGQGAGAGTTSGTTAVAGNQGLGTAAGGGIFAALLAAALYGRGADARKEGLIAERFNDAYKGGAEELAPGYAFIPGTNRTYLATNTPGIGRGLAALGYAPGSPARMVTDSLLRGPGAGRSGRMAPGLVEFKNPADKDALKSHLTENAIPLRNWAASAPTFQLNDAAQEQASKWVKRNPPPVTVPTQAYRSLKSGNQITVRKGSPPPRGYELAPKQPAPPVRRTGSTIRPTQGQQ